MHQQQEQITPTKTTDFQDMTQKSSPYKVDSEYKRSRKTLLSLVVDFVATLPRYLVSIIRYLIGKSQLLFNSPLVTFLFALSSATLFCYAYLHLEIEHDQGAFVKTLGLLVFASQVDLKASDDVLFEIAKIWLPMQTFIGLLSPAWPKVVAHVENLSVRVARNHVVILGAGERGISFLRAYYGYEPIPFGDFIIIVDKNRDESTIREFKQYCGHRVTIIHGDITSKSTIDPLRLEYANRVYIATPDDVANAKALELVRQKSFQSNIKISCHNTLASDERDGTDQKFDMCLSAARLLLMLHPPFHLTHSGCLHAAKPIVLAGLDNLNERLLREIVVLRNEESRVYKSLQNQADHRLPYFPTLATLAPLKIVIVGKGVQSWFDALCTRVTEFSNENRNLANIEYTFVDKDPSLLTESDLEVVGSEAYAVFDLEHHLNPTRAMEQIYHCLSGESHIICASWKSNPFSILADFFDKKLDKKDVRVSSFSLVDGNPSHSLLDGSQWSWCAERLHLDVYHNGSFVHSEHFADNFQAVIRYPMLLTSFGFRLAIGNTTNVPTADSNSACLSGHLDLIAGHEHERWLRWKFSQGWKYGAVRNNDFKVNDNMMPWNDERLPTDAKNKTIHQICSSSGMPKLMADLNLRIVKSDSN
jgi:hypothetical protein